MPPRRSEGLTAGERQAIVDEYLAILRSPGVIRGEQLQPTETATTVRVERRRDADHRRPVRRRPRKRVGGFYLVEADDLDEAIEIAAQIPAARLGGAVEIRPIVSR